MTRILQAPPFWRMKIIEIYLDLWSLILSRLVRYIRIGKISPSPSIPVFFASFFLLIRAGFDLLMFVLVLSLDNIIIKTYRQWSTPYTNLYTLTKRCYWLDSKIFSQPEFRNLSAPIKQPIACIQI